MTDDSGVSTPSLSNSVPVTNETIEPFLPISADKIKITTGPIPGVCVCLNEDIALGWKRYDSVVGP